MNWSRWLAIFWAGTALLMTLLLLGLGLSLLLKTATFAAMCFFLTNRKATGYFATARQGNSPRMPDPIATDRAGTP